MSLLASQNSVYYFMSTLFSHPLRVPRRYIAAYKDKGLTSEVIELLQQTDRPSLKEISQQSGIPYGTIKNWNKKLVENPHYVPGQAIGQHRKLFSDIEETNIADMIKTQYISYNVIIRRKHLKSLLYTIYQSIHPEQRVSKKIMSYQFLKGFCKRNNLSFRDMRKKKRSIIKQSEVDQYTNELCEIFKKFDPSRIANMDETPFNFVYKRGKVLAIRGKEEVDAQLPDDYKKSFTVVVTITANGNKLPPIFLARGTSPSCHKQFRGMESDDELYEVFHSKGGFSDEESMKFYLNNLHKWMNAEPCALVLDRYSAHVSSKTAETAASLNIKLVFVPTSATDQFQPLDKRVFGAIKSAAAKEFDDKAFESHEGFTQPEAADLFVRIWFGLKSHTIMSAWDRQDSDEESDEESEDSSESESYIHQTKDEEEEDE